MNRVADVARPDAPDDGDLSRIEGAHTVRNVCRDFPEWHLGRSPYVLWALDVDFPEVRARIRRAGDHLAGLLLDGYCRQPHVTLDLCGFPSVAPEQADEFAHELLDRQCSALRAASVPAVEIEVGGLASFSSAPFLTVDDRHGYIAELRHCLAVDGQNRLLGDYVPHVTVGLYADAWPVEAIAARFSNYAASERLCCRVERISLMSYLPSLVGGVLSCLADFELATGEMRWHRTLR